MCSAVALRAVIDKSDVMFILVEINVLMLNCIFWKFGDGLKYRFFMV